MLAALALFLAVGTSRAQCVGVGTDDGDLDGLTNDEEILLGTDCTNPDTDGDTFLDGSDNCPLVGNSGQAEGDGDGVGDACDNCLLVPNASQVDGDADLYGSACDCDDGAAAVNPGALEDCTNGVDDDCDTFTDLDDPACQVDTDGDTVPDWQDNCQDDRNPMQRNRDNDSLGDACDNCPNDDNEDQADGDADAVGDACDPCPVDPLNDEDADGLCADADNCPAIANPLQEDRDGDNHGDVCDNCPDDRNGNQRDRDGDGAGETCDCDDGDPLRSPLLIEVCGNGSDDDCDGDTDAADSDCAAVNLLRNDEISVVDFSTFLTVATILSPGSPSGPPRLDPAPPPGDLFLSGVVLPVSLVGDAPAAAPPPHRGVFVFYEVDDRQGWTIFIERADTDGDGSRDDIRIRR